MIGTRIAHYQIVAPLGAGGMGEVYLARDARLEREVAIKVLPARFTGNADSLARFRREALTLAALNHPNIATIHGFEETSGGDLALVLEFVPGESLTRRLERGPLPWTEALAVCAQVAEALEVAHERGVVHRDLKPGNVMIGPRGLVKVLDFGLAERLRGLLGARDGAQAPGAGEAAPATGTTAPGEAPTVVMPAGRLVGEAPTVVSPKGSSAADAPTVAMPPPSEAPTIAAPGPPASEAPTIAAPPPAEAPTIASSAAPGGASEAPTIAGTGKAAPIPTTLKGIVTGTPGYMSPEQVLAGEQDERTDVFAFGCVLYECLAGRKAFTGADLFKVMAAVLTDLPDLEALPRAVPRGVRDLIGRCLEKDAGARARDMRTIRHVIEDALGVRRAAALRAGERAATPNNLPQPVTNFVGREEVLRESRKALSGTRLLTLLGMGGTGKTRIALRLAESVLDEHPDGVWFADLGPLDEGERVIEAVAEAVGAREEPGTPLDQTLARRLQGKVLLVLDNSESVLAACRALASRLLGACADLRILATSRQALGIASETVFAVPPLAVPKNGAADAIAASESVRLFVARAIQAQPGFALSPANTAVVAEICRRLDGIPLAIELAAARVRVLAPEKILARLGDRFRLLTAAGGGADGRHQTLRAVIEWSAQHLAEEELRAFRALSTFVGSWSLESATAICGAGLDEFEVLDILQRLADKSLVVLQRDAAGDARYRYLESVRHLALEMAGAAGEADVLHARHVAWFLSVAEDSQVALGGPAQKAWLGRLDLEHDDLLAAHRWAADRAQEAEKALRLAGSLARYWSMRGHFRLARRTLNESLEKAGTGAAPGFTAVALARAASFALFEGDNEAARPLLERSLESSRRAGDEKGVARALSLISTTAIYQRDYEAARTSGEEALAMYRAWSDSHGGALILHNLGYIGLGAGQLADARRRFEEAVAMLEESGDERNLAIAHGSLGLACVRLGDVAAARAHLASALRMALGLGAERETAYALEAAAELAAAQEAGNAVRWMGSASAARERIGSPRMPAEREELDALMRRWREQLGAERAEALRLEGAASPLDASAREALAWLDPGASEGAPATS